MSDEAHWYCLLLSLQKLRGVKDVERHLLGELKQIMGDDLKKVKLIGERVEEDAFEMQSESYAFFCCSNYHKHVERLKSSLTVQLVLPSFDAPEEVPEEAIFEFNSVVRSKRGTGVHGVGDIVLVRNGYLQNLYGVVVKVRSDKWYDVAFKLYTRHFKEKLLGANLVARGSLFTDHSVKIPVELGGAIGTRKLSPVVEEVVREQFENQVCGRTH